MGIDVNQCVLKPSDANGRPLMCTDRPDVRVELEEDGSIPTQEESCPDMEFSRDAFEQTALPFISEKEPLCKEWLEEFEISDEVGHGYEETIKNGCPEHYLSTIADWCMLEQIQKYFDNNPEADKCEFSGEL